MVVSLIVAVASVGTTYGTGSPGDFLKFDKGHEVARSTVEFYKKVWCGGAGVVMLAAAYNWFFLYKLELTQQRVVELKNEIPAVEVALQNVAQADESTTDADGTVTSEETQLDTLESLQEELAEEEANLARYKKKCYMSLAVVLAGFCVDYFAIYKITGSPFTYLKGKSITPI